VAVKIGIGASFEKPEELPAPFDFHAGIGETSNMLYLKPELVKMERAKKPEMTLSPQMKEIQRLMEKHPELANLTSAYLAVPAETKKGGASHELSNNGIWTFGDPQTATKERGEKNIQSMVDGAVAFIEAWKKIPGTNQGAK
jgi:creatinine amidohydrolase